MAAEFEEAVDIGYDMETLELERSLKREMLGLLVKAKKLMWKLYGLPQNLVGQIDYIDYIISNKNISVREFREAASAFGI